MTLARTYLNSVQRELAVGGEDALRAVHITSKTVIAPVLSYRLHTAYAGSRGWQVAQTILAKQLVQHDRTVLEPIRHPCLSTCDYQLC